MQPSIVGERVWRHAPSQLWNSSARAVQVRATLYTKVGVDKIFNKHFLNATLYVFCTAIHVYVDYMASLLKGQQLLSQHHHGSVSYRKQKTAVGSSQIVNFYSNSTDSRTWGGKAGRGKALQGSYTTHWQKHNLGFWWSSRDNKATVWPGPLHHCLRLSAQAPITAQEALFQQVVGCMVSCDHSTTYATPSY